jgi:hypothetical protein
MRRFPLGKRSKPLILLAESDAITSRQDCLFAQS